ncbi:four-carbon acid sugar kinase family protein [Marinisporobacter balticus]|uniref:Uncharacterized protein YgbK (DUF1537 family) n=1 Tax=Marinisporobacter balticus TaxID=2018667 RepID=A0A4R2L2T9_9FIRM|nr:four-carbon acid sugar kinase family protein [Marinisporobacter balticus]TCO76878.1 uncharacterized protein YgbK (DUF1537 family) [Marinisporobacter balticus]
MIIIADDLTGANDTAVQYKKFGFSAILKVLHDDNKENNFYKDYDIISINADTRPLSTQQAYERVYRITKKVCDSGNGYIYKKIDSVLRGNPDSELDAVMDAMDCHLALVAPSFPENGRHVVNGVLAVGKTKINVVDVFRKGMKRKVQGVYLQTIRNGAKSLKEYIALKQREGIEVFVLDADTDGDLKIVKDTSKLIHEKKVLCGSAGLAKQLSMDLAEEKKRRYKNLKEKEKGITLVVVGSRTPETALQVKRASEIWQVPIIKADTKKIIKGEEQTVIKQCIKQIENEIEKGQNLVMVAVDSLFDDYSLVLKNSNEEYAQALCIVETLANLTKIVCDKTCVHAIVSTGGDTSLQICRILDTYGIELLDEIMPGIPVGKMVSEQVDDTLIVTKSGGFGEGDALIEIIEYLQNINYKESKLGVV